MNKEDTISCDLTVIGAGIAGMAAVLFAVNKGISVAQVGRASEVGFASGLMDLLGVHPIHKGERIRDPWSGIETLTRDIPRHPYSRLKEEDIRTAFDELLVFLDDSGLPYSADTQHNVSVMTPLGTMKTTYAVPRTMWTGIEALKKKNPCLLVDFEGLKGFSAELIANRLRKDWPDLRAVRISFPETEYMDELLPEHMANALVISENRSKLAQQIGQHINDESSIGIPAILGLYQSNQVTEEMTKLIGVPIFEIPTMPPSIPGLRLKEAFERGLHEKRPHYFPQNRVFHVDHTKKNGFATSIGRLTKERRIFSKGVILATGRFIGGGLIADRNHIRETIFNLPVFQPENRKEWHRENLFDPRGHLINLAGLETDDHFRPLSSNGQPAFEKLYAAGSLLAHQDWKRMKCGVGLAVATAYGAIQAFQKEY